jgi:4-alpha-glucanotransferase
MNVPGVAEGNWRWRCGDDQVAPALLDELADLTELYYRQPGPELPE